MLTAIVVEVFYCLDALHGERRDRSILFWKSLPVSDLTTVLSKASIPARGSAAAHLRDHRGHAVDHAAAEQRSAAGERPECRDALDTVVVLADVAAAALPPCDRACALVRALLWLAAAGLRLGAARAISLGRLAAARDRRSSRRLRSTPRISPPCWSTAWMAARKRSSAPGTFPMDPMTHLTPGHFLSSPGLWIGLAISAAFLAAAVRLRRYQGPI